MRFIALTHILAAERVAGLAVIRVRAGVVVGRVRWWRFDTVGFAVRAVVANAVPCVVWKPLAPSFGCAKLARQIRTRHVTFRRNAFVDWDWIILASRRGTCVGV